MKKLLIAVLLLMAAFYWHPSWPNLTWQSLLNQDLPTQVMQRVVSVEQWLGFSQPGTNNFKQQLNEALQNINQLDAQMVIHNLIHSRLGLNHIPKPAGAALEATADGIQVFAGDPQVKPASVQKAGQMIKDISLPVINNNLQKIPSASTRIYLFSNQTSYAAALGQAGVQDNLIRAIVQNTGGITLGSDVAIPMYNLSNQSDLANVLTHELTHVVINDLGLTDNQLPTWLNEGTAWHDGMLAQRQVNPARANQTATSLTGQVQQAAKNGTLLPLTASEDEIIKANYNVEWEDYLAVQGLIQQYGQEQFRAFIDNIPQTGLEQSFSAQFHLTVSQYENQFYNSL